MTHRVLPRPVVLLLTALSLFLLAGCPPSLPLQSDTVPNDAPQNPLAVATHHPTPVVETIVYEGRYAGMTPSDGYGPLFRLEFVNNEWFYGMDGDYGSSMFPSLMSRCIVQLVVSPEATANLDSLDTVTIADREWQIYRDPVASSEIRYYQSLPYTLKAEFTDWGGPPTEEEITRCNERTQTLLQSFTPVETTPENANFIAPRLWEKSKEDAAGEPAIGDIALQSNAWPRFYSKEGGFSFAYPSGWLVEERSPGETPIVLVPHNQYPIDGIVLAFIAPEMTEGETLQAWAANFESVLDPPRFVTHTLDDLSLRDPSGTSQQLRINTTWRDPDLQYLISHGKIVLSIAAVSGRVAYPEIMRAIGNSIEFDEDAPNTLDELNAHLKQ